MRPNEDASILGRAFRMDYLDLLAAQGTLKSLLQHHSAKALILRQQPLWGQRPSLKEGSRGRGLHPGGFSQLDGHFCS